MCAECFIVFVVRPCSRFPVIYISPFKLFAYAKSKIFD
nr:MAG TPA: hypothetical protein [Caudoviricetes sp.]